MNIDFLTETQYFEYLNEGYVVIPNLIDHALVEQLLIETDPERVQRECPKGVFVSLQAPDKGGGRRVVQQILNAELVGPAMQKLLFENRVRGIMGVLLGSDVSLFEAKIIPKAPGVGAEVPMHQDFAYWLRVGGAPVQVNLLVYLQDASLENGCLQVVPRSHRQGLRAHQKGTDGSVFNFRLDNGVASVALPGLAGTGILFNSLILHGSNPNRSNHERRVVTAVYTSASVGTRHKAVVGSVDCDLNIYRPGTLKVVVGRGPHAGQSRKHYHSRELLKITLGQLRHVDGDWIETQNCCDSDWVSEFLYARIPTGNRYLRASEREDGVSPAGVLVLRGKPCVLLRDYQLSNNAPAGLVFLSEATFSEVLLALESLGNAIKPGTVLVFDKFYGQWWPGNAAAALNQFRLSMGLGVRLLCRTEESLAVEFTADGMVSAAINLQWNPSVQGIEISTFAAVEEEGSLNVVAPPSFSAIQSFKQKVKHSRFGPSARRALEAVRSIQRKLSFPRRFVRMYQWPNVFFPVGRIPRIVGDGPFYSRSPTHERRRALWRLALQEVEDSSKPWCEFGVGDGESTDFFISQKPRENKLYAFDSFEGIPEPWSVYPAGQWKCEPYESPRSDVQVVKGYFESVLSDKDLINEIGAQVGLLHIDCDLYSSTKAVFGGLKSQIGIGTVIIFDEYYSFPNWPNHEIKAFYEWANDVGAEFVYIARSDYQVALKITGMSRKVKFDIKSPSCGSPISGTSIMYESTD